VDGDGAVGVPLADAFETDHRVRDSVHGVLLSLAAAEPSNPWFTWDYLRTDRDFIVSMLQQHVRLTVVAVILALLVALPFALVARRWRRLAGPVVAGAGVLYTIPSLGLFAMLAPFTGFTLERTVLVGLVIYALLVLLRNTIAGCRGCPRTSSRRRAAWATAVPGCCGGSSCRSLFP
jgi:osmoprotectant transport system permease protein